MTSSLCFLNLSINPPKTTCSIETLQANSPPKVLQVCKFESHVTRNDVIMMPLPKTMEQWENADLGETKQNIYCWKGFDKSFSKM